LLGGLKCRGAFKGRVVAGAAAPPDRQFLIASTPGPALERIALVIAAIDGGKQVLHRSADSGSRPGFLLTEGALALQSMTWYFLPPYCPELNRIEKLWLLVKHRWMTPKHRDSQTLENEVGVVLDTVGTRYHLAY